MHSSDAGRQQGKESTNIGLKVGASPSFHASSQDRDQDAIEGGEAGNHTHNWCNHNPRAATDAADPQSGVGGI